MVKCMCQSSTLELPEIENSKYDEMKNVHFISRLFKKRKKKTHIYFANHFATHHCHSERTEDFGTQNPIWDFSTGLKQCLFCSGLCYPLWQTVLLSHSAPDPRWGRKTDMACLSEWLCQQNFCSAKRLHPAALTPTLPHPKYSLIALHLMCVKHSSPVRPQSIESLCTDKTLNSECI